MRDAAKHHMVGKLLPTLESQWMSILAAVMMSVTGACDVATAAVSGMASSGLATRSALDRAAEVRGAVAGNAPTQQSVQSGDMAGAAAGVAASNALSVHESAAEAEGEVKRARSAVKSDARLDDESVNDALVDKIVGIESGGRSDAKNPHSSALGQGQFIKSTWLWLVEKHKPDWADGLEDADILEKRRHPAAARWAIRMYAEENIPVLKSAGVEISDAALYLSHMLDGPVAAKLYRASPNTPVKDIVGEAAFRANKDLMNGKKAKDLIAWAERKVGRHGPIVSSPRVRQGSTKVRIDARST